MRILRYILPLIAVVPLFLLRDYTPSNELRYLSIADEAIRNGDVFTFTNHGLDYADKPPLYLWIIMVGRLIFGDHCLLFIGLFSILPAITITAVMDQWISRETDMDQRIAGTLMMLTNGLFLGAALVVRMDMLMCMFIVLALYKFYRIYKERRPKLSDRLLFPFFVFMAVFTKGPVGILVPLLSTVVFLLANGKLRTLGRYWGLTTIATLLILAGLWFTAVYAEGGSEYFNNLLFNQTVNRAVDSFHHKEPFWYYMVTIWYSLAPWSLLMVGVVVCGLAAGKVHSDLERMFAVVIVTTFVTLSLVSSKIEIYMLPAFPFFCYLSVLWIPTFRRQGLIKAAVGLPAVAFAAALPVVLFAGKWKIEVGAAGITAAGILSVTGVLTVVWLFRTNVFRSSTVMACGFLAALFAGSFAIPSLNGRLGYGELSRAAAGEVRRLGSGTIYSYRVPRVENIDVYTGGIDPVILEPGALSDSTFTFDTPSVFIFRSKFLERDPELAGFVADHEVRYIADKGLIILPAGELGQGTAQEDNREN